MDRLNRNPSLLKEQTGSTNHYFYFAELFSEMDGLNRNSGGLEVSSLLKLPDFYSVRLPEGFFGVDFLPLGAAVLTRTVS